MHIRPFQADDGLLMKDVRLRSLKDAPYAFGGTQTFDEESVFPDSHWHTLAAEVGGQVEKWRDRCISYVMLDGTQACGTGSCFLCPRVAGRAYFSAAWIDSRYRRLGYGRQLMAMAIAWASAHGADHLKLWVDDTNPGAVAFYKTLGFVPTGETRPVSTQSMERESSYELRLAAE